MKRFKIYFYISVIATVFISCGNNNVSTLPEALVDMRLDLSNKYNHFKSPYQYLAFEKPDIAEEIFYVGYGGVIVYIDGQRRYCAFDMACPYEQQRDVRVRPDGEDLALNAICEKCGSTFNLESGAGYVVKGPAKEGLRRCQTSTYSSAGITYLYVRPWKY